MPLPKHYDPKITEPRLQAFWKESGVYHFSRNRERPVYSIDTPPPTVSGHLHLGHVYSYSHADFMARFWRMNGYNVFYPMGYDDNGLPTERLVERWLGITATQVGRRAFIEKCLEVSAKAEKNYEALWQRLGLSIDWRYSYRTIDEQSRRTSQLSFVDLYRQGLVYRKETPTIWCPECRTAIAQAELNDLERKSVLFTLDFRQQNGTSLPIATTRPELLPACVAVFVHPEDAHFQNLVGQNVTVPCFGQQVPVLHDPAADPEKGTGAVMCCTFGDVTDVEWWHKHQLPLVTAIARDGRMTEVANEFAGLPMLEARRKTVAALQESGLVLSAQPITQSVRVHERCDTPVEYIVAPQWFIRVLDFKKAFLNAGEQVIWRPAHIKTRYLEWVENLHWDWCISRQRYFGVTFPVWYCNACGKETVAEETQLPIDPAEQRPAKPCACGSVSFTPEQDVMDTWATSSLTPQIVGRWLADKELYQQVFPMSLRPQAHEIIRTWAFYTIVKSYHHFGVLPWKEVAISGWGLAPEGKGKISKSRGGGPEPPTTMIEKYSADAIRYWAASTGFGKDAIISEGKIQAGEKLVTKLWNVARFSQSFLERSHPARPSLFAPADEWILSRTQRLVRRATELFCSYEYASAKSEMENFFWNDLADNYLEMCKQRLYDETSPRREGTRYTLYRVLLTTIKLFAPFLPHVTEEIYQQLFIGVEGKESLHQVSWPVADATLENELAEATGEALMAIATAVRRYKSERNISVGAALQGLQVATQEPGLATRLREAEEELTSVTRAQQVEIVQSLNAEMETVLAEGKMAVAITR